jgi:exoribonuclease-2
VEPPGTVPAGHFGLAVTGYTHSTAPNRRFPDLITQRLLKAALAGHSVPYGNDELAALARSCTEEEDAAKKVERQVEKSAAAMLLESRIGERFDSIVTGASDKGTWVRLLHPPIEGKLVSGSEGVDVGHRLRVQLLRTDVERGYIDFKRVG